MNIRLSFVVVLTITISFGFNSFSPAQFDSEMDNQLLPPVTFKIIQGKEPIKAGKESPMHIEFTVLPGYHINLIPTFKITGKTGNPGVKISAAPVFDKNEIKKAEKSVAGGKSVYLDASKKHPFNLTITGAGKASQLDVSWTITLFYCSEKDGLCFRKELNGSSRLNIGN